MTHLTAMQGGKLPMKIEDGDPIPEPTVVPPMPKGKPS